MSEQEREAFLNYMDNDRTTALRDYAERNHIVPPEQLRARERDASPSR